MKQAILKDTLDVLAERVGNKVADRRWMLRPVEGADSEAELAPPGKVLTLVPMSMPVPRKDERVMVVVPAVVRPGAKAKKVLDLSKIEHVSS